MLDFLNKITRRKDIMIAVLLLAVVFMMILPLPTWLVDILIGLNISIAVTLLMLAVYINTPLEFSAFPVVVLISTIFRLALSITTTRLILLQSDAGQIVYSFGNFVVGGNLIVGLVIFLIITIVQFLVITKGSERVAEVSARFSLDAMPGKQMSIDGDMRAGVIDMNEAKNRRAKIEKESQMYGSMDGAMKFVKGDAIAGLIIILINIIGGVSIGVFQRGMSSGEALQLFSVLTIGDGLVAQIPALLISITAGIIVTRVDNEDDKQTDVGSEISAQVAAQPRALLVGGALLLLFALIPGFPTETFIILSALLSAAGIMAKFNKGANQFATNGDDINAILSQGGGAPSAYSQAAHADMQNKLNSKEEFALTVPLLIDLDMRLQSHLDANALNNELVRVRRALYLDLGVPFPGIHLRFNENLDANQYLIMLQEVPVASGYIQPGKLLVTEGSEQLDLLNIDYERDNKFLPNIETIWVSEHKYMLLSKSNIGFLSSDKILTYHLSHVLKEYSGDFIGIQEARYMLSEMEGTYDDLVKEVQRLIPIQKITEVFQRLVSEDISIRNMRAILEALVEWGQKEKDVIVLTEYVRSNLARYICYKYSSGNNTLPAYMLDQKVEEMIRNGIRQTSAGSYLALEPEVTQNLLDKIKFTIGELEKMPNKPVMIVSMDIRRYVRKLIENDYYSLPVLSFQELTPQINIQPLGRVTI